MPCEVRPGPFPTERLVRVESEEGAWVGFVDVKHLKDRDTIEGETMILGTVSKVDETTGRFEATLPGHSLGETRTFEGETKKVATG